MCVSTFKLTFGRGAHTGECPLIALSVTVDGLVGLKANKPNMYLRLSSTYENLFSDKRIQFEAQQLIQDSRDIVPTQKAEWRK